MTCIIGSAPTFVWINWLFFLLRESQAKQTCISTKVVLDLHSILKIKAKEIEVGLRNDFLVALLRSAP
jgi:hypothetical protein